MILVYFRIPRLTLLFHRKYVLVIQLVLHFLNFHRTPMSFASSEH